MRKLQNKILFLLTECLFLLLFSVSHAHAQTYPANFVTGLLPFSSSTNVSSGPQQDIIEVGQLSSDITSAQIDQVVNFSVTIQNKSGSQKYIREFCFESSDADFGCADGISLGSGQTFTVNDSGAWASSGVKNIWVTWSLDSVNYYQPLNAKTLSIAIH